MEPQMQITIESISPTLAEEMLLSNKANRPLRTERVNKYAADMVAGRWVLTGETVVFDDAGNLLSGQHRLHACVLAGVPFVTAVARGAAPESRDVVDSGLSRSVGDALTYYGVEFAAPKASAVRLVLRWEGGLLRQKDARAAVAIPRTAEVQHVLEHPEEWEYARSVGSDVRQAVGLSPTTWMACVFVFAAVDRDAAGEFFGKMIDGVDLEDGSPVAALRKWSVNSVINGRRRRSMEQIIVATKAWNAWARHERVSFVKSLPGEDVPAVVHPRASALDDPAV